MGEPLAEMKEGDFGAVQSGDFQVYFPSLAVDAAGVAAEGEGDFFSQVFELCQFQAGLREEVELDEMRGNEPSFDFGWNFIAFQNHLYPVSLVV